MDIIMKILSKILPTNLKKVNIVMITEYVQITLSKEGEGLPADVTYSPQRGFRFVATQKECALTSDTLP